MIKKTKPIRPFTPVMLGHMCLESISCDGHLRLARDATEAVNGDVKEFSGESSCLHLNEVGYSLSFVPKPDRAADLGIFFHFICSVTL